jgi:PIN domain nuclease of toxin-antitoxin system
VNGYLLDTHALLWWLGDPSRLSEQARETIANTSMPVFMSVAAAWEITIKQASGRIHAPDDLPQVLADSDIHPLPITLPHVLAIGSLPMHHHDPFDRIMIAQAQVESLTLVTRDRLIEQYGGVTMRA